MSKQETEYEREYREAVEDEGGECLKFTVPGRQGYPDRLVLWGLDEACKILYKYAGNNITRADCPDIVREIIASAIHFTEMKKPKGRYQPRQKPVIARLRAMGYRVDVVRGARRTNE